MIDRRQFLAASLSASVAPASAPAAGGEPSQSIRAFGKTRLGGIRSGSGGTVSVEDDVQLGVRLVRLRPTQRGRLGADEALSVVFGAMPELREGMQLWRYGPWNAWSRPVALSTPADLKPDDIQFLYWRDRDGLYGAAVPLSGAGFRTTLGRIGGKLAARAQALAPSAVPADLPIAAIGYGDDPHAVIRATYRAALAAMGRSDSAAEGKTLPEPLRYLGWNSWNASNLGRDLSPSLLFNAATALRGAGVPIGWMTVDDGYFDHREQRLRRFEPDPVKFPQGFAPVVRKLKREHGIRSLGIWLALDGYWHGIDPAGEIGRRYRADLFTWTERQDRSRADSPERTNTFIRPDRASMVRYYDDHLGHLQAAGFDFLKVDNQLVVERMAKGNFPVWQLATAMHAGLNAAAARHFGNAVINCMDLTADAYFNFGRTPVARAVEDYFPYEAGETYNLEKGNAAAHVAQALYNNLYVSQVAIPDFDMFESTNPNALMHAVARVANNGPIYITDQPGRHDIALVRSMALSDGRLLLAEAPLLPARDSLFQLQEGRPFKAFSRVGEAGLLAIFNLADADRVRGRFAPGDVPGFEGADVLAYEHVGGRLRRIGSGDSLPIDLPRFGAQLWTLHRPRGGFAAFGRSDKLNGAAAIRSTRLRGRRVEVSLHEMGPFAAWSERKPASVTLAGRKLPFAWSAGLLRVAAPETRKRGTLRVELGG